MDYTEDQIKIVVDRYEELWLSDEQAIRFLMMEELYSSSMMLSEWELCELHYFIYSRILDQRQFDIYSVIFDKHLESLKDSLKESDAEQEWLSLEQERTIDLKQSLQIYFLTETFRQFVSKSEKYSKEIFSIKGKYKSYLEEKKRSLLVEHLRQNRHYCPNNMKILHFELYRDYLRPDIENFWIAIDDSTKSQIHQLINHLGKELIESANLYKNLIQENNRSSLMLLDMYTPTTEPPLYLYTDDESSSMGWYLKSTLLLDKDGYGIPKQWF